MLIGVGADSDGVQHFYEQADYRPSNLRKHSKGKHCDPEMPNGSEASTGGGGDSPGKT
jgi:hypothetical protein